MSLDNFNGINENIKNNNDYDDNWWGFENFFFLKRTIMLLTSFVDDVFCESTAGECNMSFEL